MAGNDEILLKLVATETGLDNLSKKTEVLGSTLTKLSKSSIANLRQGLNELKKTVAESGEALKKMGEKASRNNKEMLFLGEGIRGYVKSLNMLFQTQLRWYGARFISQAVLEGPIKAIANAVKYTAELDKARAEMLRWEATMGTVTKEAIEGVDATMRAVRRALIEFPVTLKEASDAVQVFIGAGLSSRIVSTMVEDIIRLKVAFKEINFETFAIALTGAFNLFGEKIKAGGTAAEKFRVIFEQLLRAQAVGIIRPEQFQKVLQYMGTVGDLAGFTLEKLLAISVALTNTGVLANSASRMFRGFVLGMSKVSVVEELQRAGIKVNVKDTLEKQMSDFSKGIVKIFGFAGAINLEKLGWLQKLFPTEQAQTFVKVMREYNTTINTLTKDIEGASGGLKAASDVMTMNIASQWQVFLNVLNEVSKGLLDASGIGVSAFTAALVDIARGFLFAVDASGKFSDKMHLLGDAGKATYNIIKGLAEGFSLVGNVVKGVISIFGFWLKGMTLLTGGFDGVKNAIELISTAISVKLILSLTNLDKALTFLGTKHTFTALISRLNWVLILITGLIWGVNKITSSYKSIPPEEAGQEFALSMMTKTPEQRKESLSSLGKEIEFLKKQELMFKNAKSTLGTGLPSDIVQGFSSNALAIAKAKRKALVELLAPPAPLPLPPPDKGTKDVPVELSREYNEALLSSQRKRNREELEEEIRKNKTLLVILDNKKKTTMMSTEDFENERIKTIEGSFLRESNIIYKGISERTNLYKDAYDFIKKDAGIKEKDKANYTESIQKKELADLQDALTERQNRLSKMEEDISKTETDAWEKRKALQNKMADYNKNIAIESAQRLLEVEKSRLEIKASFIEQYYSLGLMSAVEYFEALKEINTDSAIAEKEALDASVAAEEKALKAKRLNFEERVAAQLSFDEFVIKANGDREKITEDHAKKLTEILIKQKISPEYLFEKAGGGLSGFLAVTHLSLKKLIVEFTNTAQQIATIWDALGKGMAQSFNDFFTDIVEGNLNGLLEYVKSFLKSVQTAMIAALSQQTAGYLLQGMQAGASLMFPLSKHSGGKVVSYHGGGEVDAKLLAGERVLSRDQNAMFENMYSKVMGSYPDVQVNVINESSQPVTASQRGPMKFDMGKLVTSIVLKDLDSNGPIRNRMRGA